MTKADFKKLRAETGLTQEEFAIAADVKVDRVRSWECGRNKITHLVEIHLKNVYKALTGKVFIPSI